MRTRSVIPALLFLLIACYVLFGYYQDLLFAAHLRTPFLSGALFFDEMAREPFGVMRWVGCWLTQFCFYPWLATVFYLAIWGASFFLTQKAFRLPNSWAALAMLPLGCLLLSITDLGYLVYVLRDSGYWFSHSLGYLLALVLIWCGQRISPLFASVVLLLLFPILGWYIPLVSAVLALLRWKEQRWRTFFFLLPLVSPLFWQIFYTGVSTETLWLGGFPTFAEVGRYILRPSLPFLALALLVLLMAAVAAFVKAEMKRPAHFAIVSLAVAAATFFGVWQGMFKDYNYLAEMRMTRFALADDWEGVLTEAQKAKRPSRSMVLLKNIALMNFGELGDLSFKFGNDGRDITNPDGIQVGAMQIIAPTVYFNYGKITYSIRWAIENAVCYGFSPYYLMSLIRAAEYTGETEVAEKYSTLLHSHLFYKNWTARPASPLVRSLEEAYTDVIDSDNNNVERYLIDTFAHSYNTDNDGVKELCLMNAMLYADPALFWRALVVFASANPERLLPQHYQEAYCLFMESAPMELPFKVTISTEAVQAYQSFRRQYESLRQAGYDKKTIGEALREKWGGSYWWHYFFGRNVY